MPTARKPTDRLKLPRPPCSPRTEVARPVLAAPPEIWRRWGLTGHDHEGEHAAEHHARAALAGKERHLGPRHPELAVTLTTLGTIRRRLGDAAAAVKLHRRALDLLAPSVKPGHPLLRTIRDNLAVAADEGAAGTGRSNPRGRGQRSKRRK